MALDGLDMFGGTAYLDEDNQILEDARAWAADFQPPLPEDIKTPPRRRSRKRRAQKAPSEIRSKRLQAYYDNNYRELLNSEINDAAYGEVLKDKVEGSQVGSSTWTAEEKDLLLSSLIRLGKDDIGGIAVQIGTKSEPEVQQYLQLLQANLVERKRKGARSFLVADLPAATEISDECCVVLERAGTALAARQEMAEEKVEKSKWSDIWLIDEKVSLLIDRRRREDGGEEALDAVLPAGNLFIFKNWLELSRRVFMNSGTPREEDNWESLAEPGETPGVRATAFEDFHSLTVNITKKLLSTTLFCTMSRLRSGNYHYVKVSEITADDVEAAVNILGLKSNSDQFWLDCARRNTLEVIDDGEIAEERNAVSLSYDDVERELRSSKRSRSRSLGHHEQPRSSSQASSRQEAAYSSPSEMDHEDNEDFESDSSTHEDDQSDPDSPELTDPDSPTLKAPVDDMTTRAQRRQAAEHAQEVYAEALDKQASQTEEARLWALVDQDPPFEIETDSEELERPKGIRPDAEDGRSWRDHLEYWSPWETMRTPVPKSAFERNRERKSRRVKARAKQIVLRREEHVDEHAVLDEVRGAEGSEHEKNQNADSQEEVGGSQGENERSDEVDSSGLASPDRQLVDSVDSTIPRFQAENNFESSEDY
ncbi:hypothetical protein EG329_000472 [Mollisiaceae sp. DMI_Dod_QoI]|nr:hypothetical protein EG329_000472 [Helotiales sp. DMI_Dod_QoI]